MRQSLICTDMADAFGQILLDGTNPEIIERDDGFIAASGLDYMADS